jgi:integrase
MREQFRLYRRGDVWHYDFTAEGERYRGSTRFKEKGKATQFAQNKRAAILLGTSSVPTLRQAADQWFASRAAQRKSATTIAQRLKILFSNIDPALKVCDVGAKEIEAALVSRRFQRIRQSSVAEPRFPSNSTINRDIIDTTLRPVLHYAEEIMELPVKKIPWSKLKLAEPKGRSRTFTPDELAAWRAALPEWHRPVFDFIGRYGVRLAEAFFHPDAFDPASGRVLLRGPKRKNGKPHVVTLLPEDTADMAARFGRARKAGLPTVWFRELPDGQLEPVHWRGFQSASKSALEATQTADARPAHDLRHHAATTVLRATGDLAAVQKLLGHESVASTMRYAHADDDQVLRALSHTYGTKPAQGGKKRSRIKAEAKNGRVT